MQTTLLFITSTAASPQEPTLIKNFCSLPSLEIDQDESQIPSMLTIGSMPGRVRAPASLHQDLEKEIPQQPIHMGHSTRGLLSAGRHFGGPPIWCSGPTVSRMSQWGLEGSDTTDAAGECGTSKTLASISYSSPQGSIMHDVTQGILGRGSPKDILCHQGLAQFTFNFHFQIFLILHQWAWFLCIQALSLKITPRSFLKCIREKH